MKSTWNTLAIMATLAGLAAGCNDAPQPAAGRQLLRQANDRIKALEAELAQCQASKAAAPAEDERQCTDEYAKKVDPAGYQAVLAANKATDAKFDKRVAELEQQIALYESLPQAPASLGDPPTYDESICETVTDPKARFDHEVKKCFVHAVEGSPRERRALITDWRLMAVHAAEKWDELAKESHDGGDDGGAEYEDRYVGNVINWDNGIIPVDSDGPSQLSARRTKAMGWITNLAKGGPALAWVVGRVASLNPSTKEYTAVRLQRLWQAANANIPELSRREQEARDKIVASLPKGTVEDAYAVDEKMPKDLIFSGQDKNGHVMYFKGLLIRAYRAKEGTVKGSGDNFLSDLKKVIAGVAKGMGVKLIN